MFGFRFGRKSFKREIVINAEGLETRVAVLYPLTSLHANFTPSTRSMYEPHPRAEVRSLDRAFPDIFNAGEAEANLPPNGCKM